MSRAKHKSFRRVLSVQHTDYNSLPVMVVFWCLEISQTSRTIKTDHFAVSVYLNGNLSLKGTEARFFRKSVSLNIKTPLESKSLKDINLQRMINEAFSDAYLDYRKSLGTVQGTVLWFSGTQGEIRCNTTDVRLPVYACNIKGARTWFPETACMSLIKGQTVSFNHHECGAVQVSDGLFDAEQWSKLDHDRLAFRCSEDGELETGLFSSGGTR